MARFNSSLISNTITGTTSVGSPFNGSFTQLTGTAPYTVTLASPALFPGVNQQFYNATGGTVTLSTPSGNFTGAGGSAASTFPVYTGNVVSITADGTNYVVISEDGSALTATSATISGTLTVQSTGGVAIAPSATGNIDNVNIGVTTRGSGAFNTLTSNNAVTFTANTSSSSTGTGTLVITGGLGVSGTINAASVSASLTGTIQTASQTNITAVGNLTSLTVDTTTLVVDATNDRVGIGTATPSTKLHIQSNNATPFNTVDTVVTLTQGGGNQGSGTQINFVQGAGTNWIRSLVTGANSASGSALAFGTADTGVVGTERVRITKDGNLGVGTTDPQTLLELSTTATVNSSPYSQIKHLTLSRSEATRYNAYAGFGDQFGANTFGWRFGTVNNNADYPTLYMINGNVGIGTASSPVTRLQANTNTSMASSGSVVDVLSLTDNNGVSNGVTGARIGLTISAQSDITDRRIGIYATANTANFNTPDITFWASGQGIAYRELVRFSAQNGNVGVGTGANPSAKLHVVASTPSGLGAVPANSNVIVDSNSNNYLTFRNTADNATQAGLLFQDNNVGGFVVYKNYTGTVTTGSDSMLYGTLQDHIFLNGASETIGYGGKTETFRITSSGNVGIGTATPGANLEISAGGPQLIFNANTQATNVKKVRLGSSNNTAGDFVVSAINDDNSLKNYMFYVSNAGNVGIGRTNPGYKLDVDGFARMGSYYAGSTNSTVRLAHIFQGPDLPGPPNIVTNDTGTITQKSGQITTASAGGSTFFFGPYYDLGPGNYQAKFRMKVASNSSSSYLCYIDCVGVNLANTQTTTLTPSSFTASNQYQYFNLTFTVTAAGGYIETRALNYQPVTNMSIDHILIIPL